MGITGLGDYRSGTLLSLARYADLIGIDPLRFFGGYTSLHTSGACDDTWFEYRWQDGGKVSRQEVLYEIMRAEEDIARVIGYWPAPRWIQDESHPYPQFYMKPYRGTSGYATFNHKSIKTDFGYVLYGGKRATTLITTATHDADIDTTGDGWDDTAVWTITGVTYDPEEIHAYFKEYDDTDEENCRTDPESVGADPAWEVRLVRSRYDSSTGIVTIYIPKYQMLSPQLQRRIDVAPINAEVASNLVDDLVFYRVYNDPSAQATLLWTSDEACASTACAWASQTGCIQVSDKRIGKVIVTPGTYDSTTEEYEEATLSQAIEPHKVLLSYYAGYVDPYVRGVDKLSQFFATQIAKLATSRIPRRLCTCENVQSLVNSWQEDTAMTDERRSYTPALDLNNPFGTRVGEIQVWRALKNFGIRIGRIPNVYR